MLLTLNINSLRSLVAPGGKSKPKVALLDVPRLASEDLGLHGLTLSTDLLKGATHQDLERVRDRGDKAGCACLLLVEPEALSFGDNDDAAADAAVDRAARVLKAASLLGCSSASVQVQGKDTDAVFERAVMNLKRANEWAERLEVNLLISPRAGVTGTPERTTELIKAVGGFRIGTFPDFQTAVESGDGEAYLRRLTPFAAALNASTIAFEQPEAEPEPKAKAKSTKDEEPNEPEEKASESEDDDSELSLEDLGAEAILEELAELFEAPPPPIHTAYDLVPLLRAITAVGYDGTLSIDFRGEGDGTLGVVQSRDALEAALGALAE
ncbi:MAG: TIM barrel protein [Phycisphaerales bacterium]